MEILFKGFGFADIIVLVLYMIGSGELIRKMYIGDMRFGKLFSWMVVIHFVITFLYPIMASNGGDSYYYFRTANKMLSWSLEGQSGQFIIFITYPLVHAFRLSYFGCMYVYSFIGLLGWYYLLQIVCNLTEGKWHKYYYLFLLPQLHYWTCALGKDTLIFWGICMVVYAWYFQKNIFYYILPCIIIGYVRSPVLMLMAVAYGVSFFMRSQASVFWKATVSVAIFVGAIAFMPMVEERLGGIDITSTSSLQNYIDTQVAYNQSGGSSVDLRNANIVVKIFSYIFRPLFFDARSVLQLEASFENLVWLSMFIFIVRNLKWKYMLWFPTLAFLLMWFTQGSVLNNLGIAMRQKMMFFPMFLLLFMQILYDTRKETFEANEANEADD